MSGVRLILRLNNHEAVETHILIPTFLCLCNFSLHVRLPPQTRLMGFDDAFTPSKTMVDKGFLPLPALDGSSSYQSTGRKIKRI